MIRNKLNHSAITCAIMAIAAFAGTANAAVATSNVPITMSVTSPVCTVANGNASIVLPQAAGPGVTVQAYLTANSITTAAASGGGWMTSSSLNQTATVTCSAANTTILSIGVQPGTSATIVSGNPAYQLLADAAATPAVAGGSNSISSAFQFAAELVSVNGAASPYALYKGGVLQWDSAAFNTGALTGTSSTATFVWRPTAWAGTPTASMGNPTGGTYAGSYQVVVNY